MAVSIMVDVPSIMLAERFYHSPIDIIPVLIQTIITGDPAEMHNGLMEIPPGWDWGRDIINGESHDNAVYYAAELMMDDIILLCNTVLSRLLIEYQVENVSRAYYGKEVIIDFS